MNYPVWNIAILGAVLCLVYGCLLGIVGRAQGIRIVKLGIVVSVIGTVVLASMAFVGPLGNSEPERNLVMTTVIQSRSPKRSILYKQYKALVRMTLKEAGPRPSKDHVPHADENGKHLWILKSNYSRIKTKGSE